ncbi:MAG: hypothetical protein LBK46_07745, partial [Oscillospiraceae bacterium]|nr:hypothetical protein [Oscillospiraceae bacterium]
MQYSQEQLQSILNSTLGTAPNQDDNGCPWATQHCCPSCGSAASCQTTQAQSTAVVNAIPTTVARPAQSANTGYSTTWPFFPGFPGGCYPPAPPTTAPASNGGSGQYHLIAPNQDDKGCPWATQHCCPSCG